MAGERVLRLTATTTDEDLIGHCALSEADVSVARKHRVDHNGPGSISFAQDRSRGPALRTPIPRVTASGWAGVAGYRVSSGSATFIVGKGVSHLWMASRSMARGSSAYLRRLPDHAWLSGKSVEYRLDGVALGSAVTDSNGAAALPHAASSGMATGSHTILGTFAGDARYLEDGGAATLTVTN
jgi:hypothetical protein